MAHLFTTCCSREKSRVGGDLPALERYRSGRIRAVYDAALAAGARFRILSGEYGLLSANAPIPWYDHLLTGGEVAECAVKVEAELRAMVPAVDGVCYFTRSADADPLATSYRETITRACAAAGIELSILEIDDGESSPEQAFRKWKASMRLP